MEEFGGGSLDTATSIRIMGLLLQRLAESDRRRQEAPQMPAAPGPPTQPVPSQDPAEASQKDALVAGGQDPDIKEALPAAREVQGSADRAPGPHSGTTAGSTLEATAEEPEAEQTVDPSPRSLPKRKSRKGVDGSEKEAPPGSDGKEAIRGVSPPKKAAPSSKTATRKLDPAIKKERSQRKSGSSGRSSSSAERSERIWKLEEQANKLRDKQDARRAVTAEDDRKARAGTASKSKAARKRDKDEPSSESSYYSYSTDSSDSPEEVKKKCRRISRRRSRSRSRGQQEGARSPGGYSCRRGSRSRSRSESWRRKEREEAKEARRRTDERHPKGTTAGCGSGVPQPSKAQDYHENYANNGFYRAEGGATSYQETRSGCRTEVGRRPPAKAVEWLDEQARKRNFHEFTRSWHYPQKWPAKCYEDGRLICPPKATGEARDYFLHAKDCIFKFLRSDYKYLGQHPDNPLRQHWEPFPFPKKKTKGKGRGKISGQHLRGDDRKPEEAQGAAAAKGGAAQHWFK